MAFSPDIQMDLTLVIGYFHSSIQKEPGSNTITVICIEFPLRFQFIMTRTWIVYK